VIGSWVTPGGGPEQVVAVIPIPHQRAENKATVTQRGSGIFGEQLRLQLPVVLVEATALSAGGRLSQDAAAASRLNVSQIASAALSWGTNDTTDLGAGHKSNSEPGSVSAAGLTNVAEIAGGYHFSLALLADGGVRGWPGNVYGQLGDGTRSATAVDRYRRLSDRARG
jgi:hypothetical protein